MRGQHPPKIAEESNNNTVLISAQKKTIIPTANNFSRPSQDANIEEDIDEI